MVDAAARAALVPAILAIVSMVAVHFLYLVVLAFTHEMLRALPPVAAPNFGNPYVPPPFNWSTIVRQVVPWNLPVVAALLHMLLAMVLMRTGVYRWSDTARRGNVAVRAIGGDRRWRSTMPLCLAASLPLCGILRTVPGLEGKRIVANQGGQLDWNVPQHDRYGRDAAGMYRHVAVLVESLGGEFSISAELTSCGPGFRRRTHPPESRHDTCAFEQQDRVWQYVRDGGSLLVVTGGFLPGNGLERRAE